MKSKTKKLLIVVPAVLLFLVLVAGGSIIYKIHTIKAAITGCKLQAKNFTQTIDFNYVNRWIVVNVRVEGSDKEYPFIFDTGATTVVSDLLLKDLNPSDYKVYTSGKDRDTTNAFNNRLLVLNSISIGNVKFNNVGTLEMISDKWDLLGCVSPYGIIGCNVLSACSYQIDYDNRKIIITDMVEKLPNYSTINWISYRTASQESPIIPAVLNDTTKLELLFDTGMSGGISINSPKLFSSLVKLSSPRVAESERVPTLYIRGERMEPYGSVSFKSPRITLLGKEPLLDVVVGVDDVAGGKYDGLVGNAILENYNITLDYRNKRIGFIHNGLQPTSDSTSFGFSYFSLGNKLFVGSVLKGSIADSAGIRAGSQILKLNKLDVSMLTDEQICSIMRKEMRFWEKDCNEIYLEVAGYNGPKATFLKRTKLFPEI